MSKFIDQINLPEEIKEKDQHLLHVAIVDGEFNQETLDTKYRARMQTFDLNGWAVAEKRLSQLGYSHVFVVHDPREEGEESSELSEKKSEKKIERADLIEKAVALGYEGPKNISNEKLKEIIEAGPVENEEDTNGAEMVVLTDEHLEKEPELVIKGYKAGDSVKATELAG